MASLVQAKDTKSFGDETTEPHVSSIFPNRTVKTGFISYSAISKENVGNRSMSWLEKKTELVTFDFTEKIPLMETVRKLSTRIN